MCGTLWCCWSILTQIYCLRENTCNREHRNIWSWASYEVNYSGRDLQAASLLSQKSSYLRLDKYIQASLSVWTESIRQTTFFRRLLTDVFFDHNIWHTWNSTLKIERSDDEGQWFHEICKIIFRNGGQSQAELLIYRTVLRQVNWVIWN